MADILLGIDIELFRLINAVFINGVFDVILSAVTSSRNWMPIFIVGLVSLLWKGGTKGRTCVLLLLVSVSITDPVNSRILKPLVDRQRPSHALVGARVLVPDNGGASFPSTHAANMFAAAYILSFFYSQRRILWIAIAFLVAYSRVYVGVHYPADVAGGAIVGVTIAWGVISLFQLWQTTQARYKNTGGRT